MVEINLKNQLICFLLFLSGSLSAFDVPEELYPHQIENSFVHFALEHAHKTRDFSILNSSHIQELLEVPTAPIKVWIVASEHDQFVWEEGITPLEYAIGLQDPELVSWILSKGVKVNSIRNSHRSNSFNGWIKESSGTDYYTYTPLYLSILSGNQEITEILLMNGANPQEIYNSRPLKLFDTCIFNAHPEDIYSAKMVALQLNHDHLFPLLNQIPSHYPQAPLSTVNRSSTVTLHSVEANESQEAAYRIILSNQWTLLVDHLDDFTDRQFQMISQGQLKEGSLPDFFYLKTKWKEVNGRSSSCREKTIGHAILIDPSTATYLLFAQPIP